MRKPKRIYVHEDIMSIYDGLKLSEMITKFNEIKDRFNDLTIAVSNEGWEDHYEYCLRGWRLENDTEYNKRLKVEQRIRDRENAIKNKIEQHERAEYDRLKKKFEKEN